jgi:anti-sigma-K factor RskA
MTDAQDLADAFVLGALDEAEAAEVERRIAAPADAEDRRLAAFVAAARDRLLALDLTAPEIAPDAAGWARIAAALDAAPRPDPTATPDRRPAARPARRGAPRAGGWRLAALGAMAASVALAATLALRLLAEPAPAVVAILVDETGTAAAMVEAFADDTVRVTPLIDVTAGPSRVLQLWTKPDPDGPPVSLGLLDAVTRMTLRGPDLPAPQADQLYEITIEQEGGSPTGLPTGPIVGLGRARVAM